MLTLRSGRLRVRRASFPFVVALLFLGLIASANAHTRHHRRRDSFTVALQPFLLARAAVHAVAEPIVYDAPRVLAAVASGPLRAAYRAAPRRSVEIMRAERIDEDDLPQAIASVRVAEPAGYYAQPVRLAYMVSRAPTAGQTTDDGEGDYDQEQEHEAEREVESSGSRPMVAGSRAILRNGIAYAPANAPQSVKNAIWAANGLRHKPYIWGGGHGSFADRGYDCSGTVSFALHNAGAIDAPLPSSELMRFGERGRGRWFTIYSRSGHTFAVIAGLRLDTTDFQSGGNVGPRWHTEMRDTGGYVVRHPAGM